MRFPWYRLPLIDLSKVLAVDVFPPPPDLESCRSICIATKTRTIGDALMLSTLPRRLREKYPHLKIRTYSRAFNPSVFHGNPFVSGIDYFASEIYGDDCNRGGGHFIQQKETFFGLEPTQTPRPEIYLLSHERAWAESQFAKSEKPLCFLHPWGSTFNKMAGIDFWNRVVARWKDRIDFAQVGIEDQPQVEGCREHFLFPKGFRTARKLFALLSRGDLFFGVDSAPMHISKAFQVPSLILTYEEDLDRKFALRREKPYYLTRNQMTGFLYEDNCHLSAAEIEPEKVPAKVDEFLAVKASS